VIRAKHEASHKKAAEGFNYEHLVAKAKIKTVYKPKTFLTHLTEKGNVWDANQLNKL
jgi:hypothetical protein